MKHQEIKLPDDIFKASLGSNPKIWADWFTKNGFALDKTTNLLAKDGALWKVDSTTKSLKVKVSESFKPYKGYFAAAAVKEVVSDKPVLEEGFMDYSVVGSDAASDVYHDCKKSDGSDEAIAKILEKEAKAKHTSMYNTPGWANAVMIITEKYMKLAKTGPKTKALAKRLRKYIEDTVLPDIKGNEKARDLVAACNGWLKILKTINEDLASAPLTKYYKMVEETESKFGTFDKAQIEQIEQKLLELFDDNLEITSIALIEDWGTRGISHRQSYKAHVVYDGKDNKGGKGTVEFKCVKRGSKIEDFELTNVTGSNYLKSPVIQSEGKLVEAKLNFVLCQRKGTKLNGYHQEDGDELASSVEDAKKFSSYKDAMSAVHELNSGKLPHSTYFYMEPV